MITKLVTVSYASDRVRQSRRVAAAVNWTGDETWIHHEIMNTKKKTRKEKKRKAHHMEIHIWATKEIHSDSVRKIMVTVFFGWENKGILLVDFLDHGDSVCAECYCSTCGRSWQGTCEKLRLMCLGIIIWHNNAWFHPAKGTCSL